MVLLSTLISHPDQALGLFTLDLDGFLILWINFILLVLYLLLDTLNCKPQIFDLLILPLNDLLHHIQLFPFGLFPFFQSSEFSIEFISINIVSIFQTQYLFPHATIDFIHLQLLLSQFLYFFFQFDYVVLFLVHLLVQSTLFSLGFSHSAASRFLHPLELFLDFLKG